MDRGAKVCYQITWLPTGVVCGLGTRSGTKVVRLRPEPRSPWAGIPQAFLTKRPVLSERPQVWRLSEIGMINVIHLSLATALLACTLDHHSSSRIVFTVVSKGYCDRVIAVMALVRSRNTPNDTTMTPRGLIPEGVRLSAPPQCIPG